MFFSLVLKFCSLMANFVQCYVQVIACFALKKPELRICSNVGRKGADFHGLVPYVTFRDTYAVFCLP